MTTEKLDEIKFEKPKELFSPLYGKKLKDVQLNELKDILKFIDVDDNEYYYIAAADCCSESWIEGFYGWLSGKSFATGQKILETYETTPSRQEYDQVTPHIIELGANSIATKGYEDEVRPAGKITFVLRNSSNGYYGGWLEYSESIPAWIKNYDNPKVSKFKSVLVDE